MQRKTIIHSLVEKRFARRLALSGAERDFLRGLESRHAAFARHDVIAAEGDRAEFAYVLKSGWVATGTDLADGSRQMRRVHLPGDIVGMPSFAMHHHAENIVALSDVVVAPFGKEVFGALFAGFPRLAAAMFVVSQAERITLGDRLSCIGRLPAKARLAHLLLDILYRLRAVDESVVSTFHLHMTREEVADIIGITPEHASRMWSQLQSESFIRRRGALVTILDEPRLLALSGYANRAADLDLSWLPPVRAAALAAA